MPGWPFLPLVLKAGATALTVLLASVAAEALGPVWGAIIASLPVSAGPAYVFLALRHGPEFVAASALGSAAANAATGLFLITYAGLARRGAGWLSLGAAVAVWLAASVAVRSVAWTPGLVLLANLGVYGGGLVLVRTDGMVAPGPARPVVRRWFELPVRASLVAAFVSLVVGVSGALGPAATGVAAVFPVSLISLLAILRLRVGGPASALVAAHALAPMLGFGGMLLVLHAAVRPFGVAMALGLALGVSVLWSCALLLGQRMWGLSGPWVRRGSRGGPGSRGRRLPGP